MELLLLKSLSITGLVLLVYLFKGKGNFNNFLLIKNFCTLTKIYPHE